MKIWSLLENFGHHVLDHQLGQPKLFGRLWLPTMETENGDWIFWVMPKFFWGNDQKKFSHWINGHSWSDNWKISSNSQNFSSRSKKIYSLTMVTKSGCPKTFGHWSSRLEVVVTKFGFIAIHNKGNPNVLKIFPTSIVMDTNMTSNANWLHHVHFNNPDSNSVKQYYNFEFVIMVQNKVIDLTIM